MTTKALEAAMQKTNLGDANPAKIERSHTMAMLLRRGPLSRVIRQNSRRWLSWPSHEVVGLPALSPTMEGGTIAVWKVAEGGTFAAGDVIAEIETDKATVDFEAQDDGIVAKILVDAGAETKVGDPIMVVCEDQKDVPLFKNFTLTPPPKEEEEKTKEPPQQQQKKEENPFLLTPAARFLAHSKGWDVTKLDGTGKGGRITKGDILTAINAGIEFPQEPVPEPPKQQKPDDQQPPPFVDSKAAYDPFALAPQINFDVQSIVTSGAPYDDTPATTMRKVISKRLTESRSTVPHFFTSVSVELDEVMSFRKQLQNLVGVKVSVNDIVIRAVALALQDVPRANSSWIDGNAYPNDNIDVSVAVATPTGLITPIVFAANTKGLTQISSEVRDLATRARDGKLKPHEFQGGTVSISNLGMFGVTEFSAVRSFLCHFLLLFFRRSSILPKRLSLPSGPGFRDPPRRTVNFPRLRL